ncbi:MULTISPECIES: type II toxin-antitoxin system RelE/ParE family toxin [unclassified Kitasatospora]|uniref:type II toxin-antitoxin system RelE/ParE family toxin n=1 Tax=unclassified Kitasatospora TaxID=2633591 RepID=UPI000670E816|nr:type II toxin-antitoxin system RelE/ParE family toxin [Kitasatospora sp. MY 5-36]
MTGDESRAGYGIEIEPEVRVWLQNCPTVEYRAAERAADRLAEDGEALSFPLASHLGGPLRELRIGSMRITYWLAPGRRAVLLTVFRKTGNRETDQVERARRAQKVCEAEHGPAADHEIYDREEQR